MSVGLLIISHEKLGQVLLEIAVNAIGKNPMRTECVSVTAASAPERLTQLAHEKADSLDQGQGILVLTDLYGSTPGNIACTLMKRHRTSVVSGINLPMLLRVLNYPQLRLEELADKAVSGGKEGIMDCRAHVF